MTKTIEQIRADIGRAIALGRMDDSLIPDGGRVSLALSLMDAAEDSAPGAIDRQRVLRDAALKDRKARLANDQQADLQRRDVPMSDAAAHAAAKAGRLQRLSNGDAR